MDNSKKKNIISKSYSTINIDEWEIGFYYSTMEDDDSIYIDIESVKDIVETSNSWVIFFSIILSFI